MIGLAITGFFMLAGVGGPSAVPDTLAHASPIEMPTNEAQHRPLNGDELRTLLRDAYVTPVPPAGVTVDHPRGESFLSGGRYRRFLSRTAVEGVFTIEGDLVCVEGRDFEPLCRRIVDEGGGTYAFIDAASGSSTRMSITYPPVR